MIIKTIIFSSLISLTLSCFTNQIFGDLPNSNIVLPSEIKNHTNCNIFLDTSFKFRNALDLRQNITATNSTDCCVQCINITNCNYFVFLNVSLSCMMYSNMPSQIFSFENNKGVQSGFYYFY
jgi:hypothetical protein